MRHTDLLTGAVAVELAAAPNAVAARVQAVTNPHQFPGEKSPRGGIHEVVDVEAEYVTFVALTPGGTKVEIIVKRGGEFSVNAVRHAQPIINFTANGEGDTRTLLAGGSRA